MGGFCSKCNKAEIINIEEGGWTKAVKDENKGACEFLYLDDPYVINNAVNRDLQRAIHIAAIKNNFQMIQWIVKQSNTDINIVDRDGNTALHLASQLGHDDLIEILLQYGANLNIRNKKKQKAIDIAPQNSKILLKPSNAKRPKRPEEEPKSLEEEEPKSLEEEESKENTQHKNSYESSESLSKPKKPEFATIHSHFGREIGIEIEDIVNYLTKNKSKLLKLWGKLYQNNQTIEKEKDLWKIVFALTMATLRKKYPKAKSPSNIQPIKNLCKQLQVKLQIHKTSPNFLLTQHQFINDFDVMLKEVSDHI